MLVFNLVIFLNFVINQFRFIAESSVALYHKRRISRIALWQKVNCVVITRRRSVCFRSFFCCWAIVLAIWRQFEIESMFAFACSAMFSETFAYLSDLSEHRTRYSFDCWTFALRWRFADAKTTTCCVRDSVTAFVCQLFHSLNNFSFSDAWCFSESSSFFESRFLLSRSIKTTSMT